MGRDDPFSMPADGTLVAIADECLRSSEERPVYDTDHGYLTCGIAPSGSRYLLVGKTTDADGSVDGDGAVVVNLGGPAEPPLDAVLSWLTTQNESFRDEHPMIVFVKGPPDTTVGDQQSESCETALQRLLGATSPQELLRSLPSCDYGSPGNDFETARDDVVWAVEQHAIAGLVGYSFGASLFLAIAHDAYDDSNPIRVYADSPRRYLDDWRDRTSERMSDLETMWGDFQGYCQDWTGGGSRIQTENQNRQVECDWTLEAALQGFSLAERVLVARSLYRNSGTGEYLDTYGLLSSREARSKSIEAEGIARVDDTTHYWSAVCTLNASNPANVGEVGDYLEESGANAPGMAELAFYLEVGGCVGVAPRRTQQAAAAGTTALITGNSDDPLLGIDNGLGDVFPNLRIELLEGDQHLLISRSFECNAAAVDSFFAGAPELDTERC